MQCCLSVLVFLAICSVIATLIYAFGDWTPGRVAMYILTVLLASAGVIIALGAVVAVFAAVIHGMTRSRLEARADRSEEDRKKYEEFLAREEQRRIRAEEPKQEQLLESQRRTRWKEYPEQSILKALADGGEPCLLVSLLKGRRSFIAVSKDELKLVLGAVNIDNESLGHHQAFAGPEIIGVDSGDKLKVSTFTNGSGGLVVFGDIDSGSKGSQTAHDSRVMSSCIFLTVRDMVSPLKQIVFDSPIECRQWLGRIKIIQTSYLKYLSGLEADMDVDDDWSRDDLSPWDDDSLEE